jgi:hypothetical protein
VEIARLLRVGTLGLGLTLCSGVQVGAAEGDLNSLQGAWLAQTLSCEDVFSTTPKGHSFKRPINIFAPAFIISGRRLRTPLAACRIQSAQRTGERQALKLLCANAVGANDVTALLAVSPDGSLRRYFNENDPTGDTYRRCNR